MVNKVTKFYRIIFLTLISVFFTININAADYPNTSLAVIDFNLILNESKVAISANKQIEIIAKNVEEELQNNEKNLLDDQRKLIEAQAVMAPEAFEEKRIEYEKKVQNFQIKRQESLNNIDRLIAITRSKILDEVKPILEEISTEKGITVILEKNTVILNAENMDITKEVLKDLNKNFSELTVELEE